MGEVPLYQHRQLFALMGRSELYNARSQRERGSSKIDSYSWKVTFRSLKLPNYSKEKLVLEPRAVDPRFWGVTRPSFLLTKASKSIM